ncbi:serine hydrolase family protein [bacterium]|nr:serine hydrolase family protein [bacterium]
MKILFLHGLDAQPGGIKPTYLTQQGHEVMNPALPRDDFDESLNIARAQWEQGRPDVIVGSSRGGALALAMDQRVTPMILLAPAWRFFLPSIPNPCRADILHAPLDALVPIDHSRELALAWPTVVRLFEIGQRHTLTDAESLARMDQSVRELVAHSP